MKKKSLPIQKLVNLAVAGKLNTAFKVLKKAINGKNAPEIWVKLSGIYGAQGNLQLSRECCEKALVISPEFALAYSHLGNVYLATGDTQKAVELSQRAVNLQQNDPTILYNFALICRKLGDHLQAIHYLEKAIELRPDHAASHYTIGSCYQTIGDLDKLVKHYEIALSINSKFIDCLVNLGLHYINIGDYERSIEYLDKTLLIDKRNNFALSGKAGILARTGDKAGAYDIVRYLIDNGSATVNTMDVYSLLGKDYGTADELIKCSEAMLRQNIASDDKMLLGFSLGRTYDRLGKYDKAFRSYKLGNEASECNFDAKSYGQFIQSIVDVYSRDNLEGLCSASNAYDEPVFILGMPRSGTSLIEQILSSHSQVFSAGELNYITELTEKISGSLDTGEHYPTAVNLLSVGNVNDLVETYMHRLHKLAGNSSIKRITDKMPANYTHVGFISQLFPNARIIHCMRDPRDTCLSIYFQNFQNFQQFSADLQNIGEVYLHYKRLMDHWNDVLNIPILNVQYESVVENAEEKAREIIEFCGLEWEDECMEFYKSKRNVITASFDQVNKPIYTKSVARWRNYEKHLDKLQGILQPVLPK